MADDILVTGVAGFIGFHTARGYLESGRHVVGIDNLNDYYDPELKRARLAKLAIYPDFRFFNIDISDSKLVLELFEKNQFDFVVHLAAQAGVRYSIENPDAYIQSNVTGFLSILEACRYAGCRHLVYASSSSVYGSRTKMPFSVSDNVDHPISLYAATKKSNELFAHTYSHLYGIPTTGLRFFTVYGPWGRPDMALFLFTDAILSGKPIKLFNNGEMLRDFTYIDDVADAVLKIGYVVPRPNAIGNSMTSDPGSSTAPYRVYNIGNSVPVRLLDLIATLESCIGRKSIQERLPMQPGDVPATFADVRALEEAIGFTPSTSIEVGVDRFVRWFRDFYQR